MISDESGVKFFDRKFVAANLRSELRCPKCLREYSHRHNAKTSENYRPFLLSCGHNMCEFCISNHRKEMEFKCAVCFNYASPTLHGKDPKADGNIRDYYELNYHVLGEVNSLNYFNRYSVGSVNKSLLCSTTVSDIVLETKCSECGHVVAKGECTQCNAFYCRRCFEMVHNHSRVLKTHVFQHLGSGGNSQQYSKGVRVGKENFRMPDRMQCCENSKTADIYCKVCKRTCCNVCKSIFHQHHKTCLIDELNQRYVTEVPASINSIDAALLQLNNAQMVVKNTKKKLSDFADVTLAGISKHFRLLHGQLQNAELQAIERLRESSLPPQIQLNAAMSRLNGYAMVLNKLRDFLCPTIAQDIWLKEVIGLIHEHLDNIPTYVDVTKLERNPFHFSSSIVDLPNMMKQHFISKFIDPQIKVFFKKEHNLISSYTYSDNRSSRPSVESDVSWRKPKNQSTKLAMQPYSGKSKKQKLKTKKAKNKSSSISSIELHTQENNFLSSFSALDISKSTATRQVGDWFKSDAVVHVRGVNSPENFYVQSVQVIEQIREQLLRFTATSQCQKPDIIVVGQQYLVFDSTDNNAWHRALVSQKTGKPDIYKVFLPDIGLNHQVHGKNFRRLPEELAVLPYAAVNCSLKQLMPSNGTDWEPSASAFLKQLVQNKPVHVNVLRALGPQYFEVDLITTNYKSTISVRESFLYTGQARCRHGYGHVPLQKPQQLVALPSQQLPKYELQLGVVLMVQLLEVSHPQDFYVMLYDQDSKRYAMENELQRVMNLTVLSELEPIYLGRLQLGCVTNVEGYWQRACIESLLPNGFVEVRLVDRGEMLKLYWDQLFMLPERFWRKEFAIKCSLADVETLQKHEYMWTKPAIGAFKQLASNPKLLMEVIGVRDHVTHVSLSFKRSANDNTNVAALLVSQGHCLSTGESSKIIKPIKDSTPLNADTRKFIELNKVTRSKFEPFRSEKLEKIERTSIEVLHIVNPSEFYVTLSHFLPSIPAFRECVQKRAEVSSKNHEVRHDWRVGDMCLVRIKATADMDLLWHRAVIVKVVDEVPCNYTVKLRDIGELVENVPASRLVNIDEDLASVSNNATHCYLYGISPTYDGWSSGAIQFFKAQLLAYSSLHVTGHGRNDGILCVNLWGSYTVISGPFSPADTKYVSINEKLVSCGWAVKNKEQLESEEPKPSPNTTITIETNNSKLQACLERVDKITANSEFLAEPWIERKPSTPYYDEMPPLDLLDELNSDMSTTGSSEAPLAWQTQRKCKKSIFTARPTYVNMDCEIYLTLPSDKPFISHMCKVLAKHFGPMLEQQRVVTYVVGQAVLVKYHLDNQLYRGIVKSTMSAKGEYKVYYVDFGNEEDTLASEMLPFAPFPRLKALCWRVTIHGVQPKDGEYTQTAMDNVHYYVVTKMCSIRVVSEKGPHGFPSCQIKVAGVDIATMMIDNDFAERASAQVQKKTYVAEPQETLESFKIFDELLRLGEVPSHFIADLNNSTVKSPPTKKKFLMDTQQMQCLGGDEDFDCKEDAMKPLQISVDFDRDTDESDNDENEENSLNEFSDDYVVEEEDEGIVNETKNFMSPEPVHNNYMPSPRISAMEQLQRRIHLRNKDMLENAHFSPMDTSTERSYHADVGCFKSQNLPTGVKQFGCRIDKVLSATELQISPQLTEYTKQEISLAQETSALIRNAKQLDCVELNALCLARYTQDNQWYRAIIEELNQSSQQATVFYIDFHDTEMVPFTDLKVMPKELFMFPQRSFRVKLHGIKVNKSFSETAVRHSLQACLCKYPVVFARVQYPLNYNDNSSESSSRSDATFFPASVRQKFKQLEVDIYENDSKSELLYKPLIDSRMYLLK